MTRHNVILVGDIGGTNARFAIADPITLDLHHTGYRRTADFATLCDALQSYLAQEASGLIPTHAAIAVASPVGEDKIKLTNNHWQFSVAALKQQLALAELRMLNDFTVQALAIPHLQSQDFTRIGPDVPARPLEAIGVLGPGTGLGVSGLIPNGCGGYAPISGEGGHSGIVAETEQEIEILRFLWKEFGRSSIERIICGSGIVVLYRALCHIRSVTSNDYAPEDITRLALAGECGICHDAIMQFCAFLGGFAGDLALTLGARGGIYIAGGVVPRFGDMFAQSPFRARFENKGRFQQYLAAIPTYVVAPHDNPALLGAASIFQETKRA
ncbi:MAG: glucokinase [Alphaproteobacteria bacterium]|nr:glucokinase [Alphaproteobacteria bacterium]